MKTIVRESYLEWMNQWKNKQIIKVISGVRRCGKSTMFEIFRTQLISEGVLPEQIITINFESIEFEDLTNYRELYQYITEHLHPNKMNYIMLDEIQHVEHYEKVADSLFIKDNCDVYITGSNAYFMSGELATLLSGRYVELKMLPLSFFEFNNALQDAGLSTAQMFNRYITYSSFPYVLKFDLDQKSANEYLQDIYHTILLKDIVARLRVQDVSTLENITKFMLHNIGNLVSGNKIANTLKTQGTKIDTKTVEKYIRGLRDSLILYEVTRYNIKGKQFLMQQSKYYCVDVGIRNMLVRRKESDVGHILENIVYLELLRRGYQVYVGSLPQGEVDFVAMRQDTVEYYQVSATTLDEHTLERELKPLRMIHDNYPKYLLTLDEVFKDMNYEGILKRNVMDWLLENGK